MKIARTVLPARPSVSRKRTRAGEKAYTTYRVTLPAEVAKQLGLTGGEAALVAWLAPARWYHLFDWENPEVLEEVLPRLTERERLELCATLAPEKACGGMKPHILLAKPEELRELGLDPEKPITLEDIIEAVKKSSQQHHPRQPPKPQYASHAPLNTTPTRLRGQRH